MKVVTLCYATRTAQWEGMERTLPPPPLLFQIVFPSDHESTLPPNFQCSCAAPVLRTSSLRVAGAYLTEKKSPVRLQKIIQSLLI